MASMNLGEVLASEVKEAHDSHDPRRVAVAEAMERSGFVTTHFTDSPSRATEVVAGRLSGDEDLPAMELVQVLESQKVIGVIDEGLAG